MRRMAVAWFVGILVGGLPFVGARAALLPAHTGDINDDGTVDINDVSCYAMTTLTSLLGLAPPACKALTDADADLQCDGAINILDVHRDILVVLFSLTGDPGAAALLQVHDHDLDFIHDQCDLDDDGDGFPDTCEVAQGTDPLDAASTPCDDGVACTADACDAANNCTHTPNDAACDDGDPCTQDACGIVTGCVNAPASTPGCFTPPTGLCALSGASGDTVFCLIRVARVDTNAPLPVGMQLTLSYDGAVATILDVQNANGAPVPPSALPTGHTVWTVPDPPTGASGALGIVIDQSQVPDQQFTDVYVNGALPDGTPTSFSADPTILQVLFQLSQPIDPATPSWVTAGNILATNSLGEPIYGQVRGTGTANAAIVLGTTDCNADPTVCDDGNPCTNDACDAASGSCSHTFNDGAACDDGDACTTGDSCSGGVCAGTIVTCDAGCGATCNLAPECSSVTPTILSDAWRNVTVVGSGHCDSTLPSGWYRFDGAAGTTMPTVSPGPSHCGTDASGWINGSLPAVGDGVVTRTVCFDWSGNSCSWSTTIQVVNCASFYLFNLVPTPTCSLAYCGTN